jgi:rhodanese-related sulfurtransferase
MKIRLIIIFMFLMVLTPVYSQVTDSLKYTVLKSAEFIQKFQSTPNSVLIDVRDSKDFNKSRIRGAINMPYPIIDEYLTDTSILNPDKSLFVYCYAGFRSRKSAVIFYNKGFRNIYSLEGGLTTWKLKKMPVDRKKRKGLTPNARRQTPSA